MVRQALKTNTDRRHAMNPMVLDSPKAPEHPANSTTHRRNPIVSTAAGGTEGRAEGPEVPSAVFAAVMRPLRLPLPGAR
jgi:hypothetical protein